MAELQEWSGCSTLQIQLAEAVRRHPHRPFKKQWLLDGVPVLRRTAIHMRSPRISARPPPLIGLGGQGGQGGSRAFRARLELSRNVLRSRRSAKDMEKEAAVAELLSQHVIVAREAPARVYV